MALIIVFQNQSNLAPVSDYTVEVIIGDGTRERSHTIHKGVVKGHRRADGWQQLVQQFISHAPLPEKS